MRLVRYTFSAVLLLAALCGCVPTTVATECDVTRPQAFVGGANGQAIIGGNLAYSGSTIWRVNTDEKAPWLWRTSDKTQRLRLKAERIDGPKRELVIDLGPAQELPPASPNAPTFAPEWGGDRGYGGYVGLGGPKLPEVGCWRLSVSGGAPDDAIVVRVVAAQASPSGAVDVPGSCSKQTATRLVDDFFARWNSRDAAATAALFSPSFSFSDNLPDKRTMLNERGALQGYLADRFSLGDRFSNVVADIPENPSPARANPTVSFARSVGATTYRGNAKMVCADNLLRELVMSAE